MKLKTINKILSKIGLVLIVKIDFHKKSTIELYVTTKKNYEKLSILPCEEYFYRE